MTDGTHSGSPPAPSGEGTGTATTSGIRGEPETSASGSQNPPPAPPAAALELPDDLPRPWMPTFLQALATLPNVSAACRTARVSRQQAHHWFRSHEPFRLAWVEAREIGLDIAEQIAYNRGVRGEERRTTRTKVRTDNQGNVLERETTDTTSVYVSDQLLVLWLRAHRPEKWGSLHQPGSPSDLPAPLPPDATTGPRRRTPERLAELLGFAVDAGVLEAEVIDGVARIRKPPDAEPHAA